MPNLKKITDLPSASTPLSGGELFEISQKDINGKFKSRKVSLRKLVNPLQDEHNELKNIQGGDSTLNEYYHLDLLHYNRVDNDEYTLRTETANVSASGLQQAKDYTDTEILALSASYDEHNELKNIQGGAPSAYYHLDQDYYNRIINDEYTLRTETATVSAGLQTQIVALSAAIGYETYSGIASLSNGVSAVNIIYDQAQVDEVYSLVTQLRNEVDSPPSIYNHIVTSKTALGFSVLFSGILDSGNYKLDFILSRNQSASSSSVSSSSSSLSSSSSSSSLSSSSSSSSLSSSSISCFVLASDDFTGINGSQPNVHRWEVLQNPNGYGSIQNNMLNYAGSPSAGDDITIYQTRYTVDGDFDARLDFLNYNDAQLQATEQAVYLEAYVISGGTPVSIGSVGRRHKAFNEYRSSSIVSPPDSFVTPDVSGALRITRQSGVVSVYVLSGGTQWEWNGIPGGRIVIPSNNDSVYFRIFFEKKDADSLTVDVDNFTLTYDSINCANSSSSSSTSSSSSSTAPPETLLEINDGGDLLEINDGGDLLILDPTP